MTDILNTAGQAVGTWFDVGISYLPDVLLSIGVFVGSVLLARIVRQGAQKAMARFHEAEPLQNLGGVVAYMLVILIGIAIALSLLDLGRAVTSLLAGAGILGFALGFAFQDIIANFIAGFVLAVSKPFETEDIIETNNFTGTVKDLNLRTTTIRTFQGELVMVPNKDIFHNPLTNYTSVSHRRIDLPVGVSYGSDLAHVQEVVVKTIGSIEGVSTERPIDCLFQGFGDNAIDLEARFWVPVDDYVVVQSRAVIAIKTAFDQEGIVIPFPVRTVEITHMPKG